MQTTFLKRKYLKKYIAGVFIFVGANIFLLLDNIFEDM